MQGKATPEKSGVSVIQENQVQSGHSVGPIPPAGATPRIALEKRGDQRMRRVLRALEFIQQAFKHAVLLARMQIARIDEEEIQFCLVIAHDHGTLPAGGWASASARSQALIRASRESMESFRRSSGLPVGSASISARTPGRVFSASRHNSR